MRLSKFNLNTAMLLTLTRLPLLVPTLIGIFNSEALFLAGSFLLLISDGRVSIVALVALVAGDYFFQEINLLLLLVILVLNVTALTYYGVGIVKDSGRNHYQMDVSKRTP